MVGLLRSHTHSVSKSKTSPPCRQCQALDRQPSVSSKSKRSQCPSSLLVPRLPVFWDTTRAVFSLNFYPGPLDADISSAPWKGLQTATLALTEALCDCESVLGFTGSPVHLNTATDTGSLVSSSWEFPSCAFLLLDARGLLSSLL